MTHPEDRERLQEALGRVLKLDCSEQIEFRVTGLDGIERTVWIESRTMLGPDGRVTRIQGACQDMTDRKAMQAALRESEDHYRHAVELNPQIPWTADPEGNVLEAGPRWLEYIGMSDEEGLGTGWVAALHPDDVAPTLQAWSACLASGEPVDFEYRLRLVDGRFRWFRARASARRDSHGAIIRWYGTLEDIQDRKTADIALRESEVFARSILDSTTDCIRVLDLDGRVRFMNGPGLESLEIDDFAEVEGKSWEDCWPLECRRTVHEALETARGGGAARFTGSSPTAKGTAKWWDVSVSPIAGPDGRPARLLATSRDMTLAKLAQDELERAKHASEVAARRLSDVLESTTDCVFMLDRDWHVTFINPQAKELIANGRDLLGANLWEAFPGAVGTRVEQCYRDAVANGRPVHLEEFYPPLGTWLEVHAYPSADRLSVFFRDVTERRRVQEEIARSMEEAKAASRAKSEFLATMSHEIRTPMNGVLGMAEHLAMTDMASDQREMVREIQASGAALLRIIDDVLDFSKVEAGKLTVDDQPTDLRESVRMLRPIFGRAVEAQGIGFAIEIDPELRRFRRTDAARLRQILTNLVGNAVKFTHEGSGQAGGDLRPGGGRRSAGHLRRRRHRDRHPARGDGQDLPPLRAGGRLNDAALRRHGARPRDQQEAGAGPRRRDRRRKHLRTGQHVHARAQPAGRGRGRGRRRCKGGRDTGPRHRPDEGPGGRGQPGEPSHPEPPPQ